MNPQYSIREAKRSDADQMFPIVVDFATSFAPLREPFDVTLGDVLRDASARLLVADAGAQIVGYLLGFDHRAFFANGRVSWVEEVAVDAQWRGRGVGRALMQDFEAWASSRGSKLVGLATRRASAFYRSLGYEESASYFRKLL